MPLDKSSSKNSVSKNIKTELAVGKPLKQAQAIALNVKNKLPKTTLKLNKPAPMLGVYKKVK